MFPYLKRLFTDEGAFVGMVRTAFMIVGLAVTSGQVPVPDGWEKVGFLGVGAAMLMRSSASNGKPK